MTVMSGTDNTVSTTVCALLAQLSTISSLRCNLCMLRIMDRIILSPSTNLKWSKLCSSFPEQSVTDQTLLM
jgi:hypothetical protein